ncbi:MAG TPA: hypothetical protein VGL10_03040, partial [Gammaproteobacteria bacterium]
MDLLANQAIGVIGRIFTNVKERLHKRPDAEFRYSVFRLLIAFCFSIYLLASYFDPQTHAGDSSALFWLNIGLGSYILFAFISAVLVFIRPGTFQSRRLLNLVIDCVASFCILYFGRQNTMAMLMLFPWIALGHGLSYGTRYLVLAGSTSLITLSMLLISSVFWQQHLVFGIGVLMTILVMTAIGYFLTVKEKLTRRSDSEHEQAVIRIVIASIA